MRISSRVLNIARESRYNTLFMCRWNFLQAPTIDPVFANKLTGDLVFLKFNLIPAMSWINTVEITRQKRTLMSSPTIYCCYCLGESKVFPLVNMPAHVSVTSFQSRRERQKEYMISNYHFSFGSTRHPRRRLNIFLPAATEGSIFPLFFSILAILQFNVGRNKKIIY